VDHIVPTDEREEPFSDSLADAMIKELRKNFEESKYRHTNSLL
jgi:3-isopropylmalate/(R)-2-methylmalate dehydratase large subunit